MSYDLTLTLTAEESAAYDSKRHAEWQAARESASERAATLVCETCLDNPTLYRGRPFKVSFFHPDGRPAGWFGLLVSAELGYRSTPVGG